MAKDERRSFGFVLLMTLMGLLSGVVTAGVCGAEFEHSLGAPFGLVIACFLLISRIVRNALKAIGIVALSTAAFFVSVMFADFVELGLGRMGVPAGGEWSFGGGLTSASLCHFTGSGRHPGRIHVSLGNAAVNSSLRE